MKTIALIVRRPDVPRDAFRAHYEQVHAPLGLTVMRGLVRYVRHHVREELAGDASFDALSAFRYRDAAALEGVIARLASPAGDAVRADELTFMDKARNRFFAAREVGERGAPDRSAPLQCVALWRRGAQPRAGADAPAALGERALAELHDAVRGLRWSLRNEALASFGEPPWDAVVQLHAEADASLAAWCAAREREGGRAAVVRVTEHETPLPAGGLP